MPVAFVAGLERFDLANPVDMENGFDWVGQPMVTMKLAKRDANGFAAFTARHIGETLEVRVCDRVLISPMLLVEISSGVVVISGSEAWTKLLKLIARGCP